MVGNKNLGHCISQVLALVFKGEGQKSKVTDIPREHCVCVQGSSIQVRLVVDEKSREESGSCSLFECSEFDPSLQMQTAGTFAQFLLIHP